MVSAVQAVNYSTSIARRVAFAFLFAALVSSACAEDLSDAALRGKQVYHAGESASGRPIKVFVSRGAAPIPAAILPCSGCHGEDGEGRPEGGVVPSDITWQVLTKEYGHEHDYGRTHPAFDAMSIAAAVTHGTDPAGNELDFAMPRYAMHTNDMADLIAYMRQIADDSDPGIDDQSIRVASLLPASGRRAPDGEAMRQVMTASINDINDAGGIHGRKLELVVIEGGEDLSNLAEEFELPMVGPATRMPRPGDGLSRFSFYLLGGLAEQAAILGKRLAAERNTNLSSLAVVRPQGEPYERAEASLLEGFGSPVDADPITLVYQPPYLDIRATVDSLIESKAEQILFLGSASQLKRLATEARSRGIEPDLLLPGVFAGREMFDIDPEYSGRLLVGYSTTPADHTVEGVREFELLHERHEFGYQRSASQISAFVAVQVLAEGLKRAGKNLSREKLVHALEGLTDYRSGLMPPISFNHSRRIGALGGYVLPIDATAKGFGEPGDWIAL
jgi:ABC-type branched-subunit amino acid transport system substrate-binding protein